MNKLTLPRNAGWVIFIAFLALMLTPTIVTPARGFLTYFRWVPLAALCLLALVLSIRLRSLPRPLYRADAIVLAFIGLAFFSAIYSIDPQITIARAFTLLLVYGALFWGIWLYADAFGVESVIRFPVLAAAVAFALHIVASPFLPTRGFPYYGRFAGWAENPGTVGALASLTFPLTLWQALKANRWYYWTLVGVSLIFLVLSQARVEALAVALGTGYLLLRAFPRRKLRVIGLVIAFLGIHYLWSQVGAKLIPRVLAAQEVSSASGGGVGAGGTEAAQPGGGVGAGGTEAAQPGGGVGAGGTEVAQPGGGVGAGGTEATEPAKGDPRYSLTNLETIGGRSDKWAAGLVYFLERPLFGFGFGTEDRLFAFHSVDWNLYGYTGSYFHNSYLGMALQLGAIGIVLFFLPLAILVWREIRTGAIVCDDDGLARVALLGVVLGGMTSAFLSSWVYAMGNHGALPFWMSVMLLARYRMQENSKNALAIFAGRGASDK